MHVCRMISKYPFSSPTMDDIKLYLKPRPAHPKFGDRPWMLLNPDFPYGPFCSAWGTIPSDATEVYTIHSHSLTAALTKLEEILPKLRKSNTEISRIQASAPTSPFHAIFWDGFRNVAPAQVFLADCQYQTVKLVYGDKTPPKPARYRNNPEHAPEFWKLMEDAIFPLRQDVELIELDLQRLLWTSILLLLTQNIKPLSQLLEEVVDHIEGTHSFSFLSCFDIFHRDYMGIHDHGRPRIYIRSLGEGQAPVPPSSSLSLHQ
ncbi:uncharacterized protein EV420DRAFT_310780 [Desarmillaria tabescens]|uniref:Uncharacterized protein n=1 Tax=Armillaria tabescens TaxID=1929756 RepID=A0AA39KG45_ARMTA|nr:uncharacterized protein EV420DRAFT_310780 [Desarmillaria tabescens]KAK0459251.1 hypothetical protein EV420DRAFT_310780 [Desarmillaria tabescens]